jgi:hypothetical protein
MERDLFSAFFVPLRSMNLLKPQRHGERREDSSHVGLL